MLASLKFLIPQAHGEYPSCLHELVYFHGRRWSKLFAGEQLRVVRRMPARLFYTGYTLAPFLPLGVRRWMSFILGSSCNAFLLEPSITVHSANSPTSKPARAA